MSFGTVKWYSPIKGYGFILCGDRQVFFHYTSVLNKELKSLNSKDKVEFDLYETSPGKYVAKNIVKI